VVQGKIEPSTRRLGAAGEPVIPSPVKTKPPARGGNQRQLGWAGGNGTLDGLLASGAAGLRRLAWTGRSPVVTPEMVFADRFVPLRQRPFGGRARPLQDGSRSGKKVAGTPNS